jgi:hypothetical protein
MAQSSMERSCGSGRVSLCPILFSPHRDFETYPIVWKSDRFNSVGLAKRSVPPFFQAGIKQEAE